MKTSLMNKRGYASDTKLKKSISANQLKFIWLFLYSLKLTTTKTYSQISVKNIFN